MKGMSDFVNQGLTVFAGFLLLASALLILNTIRTAMFARRREIEVMKLVGATNWFIRVPFMLEGLVQGLLGGVLAVGFVFLARELDRRADRPGPGLDLLQPFSIQNSDVVLACVVVDHHRHGRQRRQLAAGHPPLPRRLIRRRSASGFRHRCSPFLDLAGDCARRALGVRLHPVLG